MAALATPTWYERDGVRVVPQNGRTGFAECLQTSPATNLTPPEDVLWLGSINKLEIAMGNLGYKFNVLRSEPLNVTLRGSGKGSAESVISSFETRDQYVPGVVNPNPAIHRFVITDALVDLRGSKAQYPLLTGINTLAGKCGMRRVVIRSDGKLGSVLSAYRGNAAAEYIFVDVEADDGTDEYLIYCNLGPGGFKAKKIKGKHFGRGLIQVPLRWNENGFYVPDTGDIVDIEDIDAEDTGSAGAGVVNVWGGYSVRVAQVKCLTSWATFAVVVGFDAKQAQTIGSGSTIQIVGPGKILNGRASELVTVDLRGSKIVTGVTQGGSQQESGRPAVGIDSSHEAWLISDEETSVQSGGHGLELEWNGKGPIKTKIGQVIGTRSIGEMHTAGNFSGWDSFKKAGAAYHPDEDMSDRGF